MKAAILALLAATAWAQAPATVPGVEGVVTNSIGGEPIRNVHISLRGQAGNFGAISTVEGRFSIDRMAAGTYEVTAQRTGFLPAEHLALEVKRDADRKTRLDVKMLPAAVIAGKVVDDAGNPMEAVEVAAMRGPDVIHSGTTDDTGTFRIGGLRQGKYRLRAARRQAGQPPEIRTDGSKEIYYAPTYYLSSLDAAQASPVEAKAGIETGGIQIRMQRQPIVGVSGRVTPPPQDARNTWIYCDGNPVNRIREDGTFTAWRLPPGPCHLWAQFRGMDQSLRSAPIDIVVGSESIDGIAFALLPAFELNGRIIDWKGGKSKLMIMPVDPATAGVNPIEAEIDENGAFSLRGVAPERYRVHIDGLPAESYIDRLRLGTVDMSDRVLDVRRGATSDALEVRVSAGGAQITGIVKDEKGPIDGAQVMLRSESGVQRAKTKPDGSYHFQAIAPGKYRLYALSEWETQGFMPDEVEKIDTSEGDRLVKDLLLKQ